MLDVQELADSRPAADHSIEQFLMNIDDIDVQANLVGEFLGNQRVFFLGDDDHISPIVADRFDVIPTVYEYDHRVRENLLFWFGKLGVAEYVVKDYDARFPAVVDPLCNSFYINPPYSSKSEGLGIKVWLMRALEACEPGCHGVLVMPRDGGNIQNEWVGEVQDSVDDFIKSNGMIITKVENNTSSYEDTTQPNLQSSNVYLSRVNKNEIATVEVAGLYN